jgi:hypothetical protein
MKRANFTIAFALIAMGGGCLAPQTAPNPEFGSSPANGNQPPSDQKIVRTLLEWNLCKKEDKKEDVDKKEKGAKDEKSGDEAPDQTGNGKKEGKNGNGENGGKEEGNRDADDKAKEDEVPHQRLDPDRPHLPEASSTVGLGHIVLESGFTYNTSGGYFPRYSYPESLLRIGMFADWFELRIAQNVLGDYSTNLTGRRAIEFGAQDMQIGVKLAMTEQQQWLPESALILQMYVPTGSPGYSANRVLPGIHYDCSWEIIKEKLSVETVILADGSTDNYGHTYTQLGHAVTAVYDITKRLEAFGEIDSFYSVGESFGPQHYFVGGFVYFLNKNFEIDIRSGVGLNRHAQGYLLGSGFAVRY